ncbi:MAG TPA: alpha/beta hydrolase [Acidobacteriota bacterium]|jgi:pimeloyl-ACP methyl ester carboxylesterase|nr:alpha/beta hydrolase [Acidobacteriota bacterium]HNT18114.1 alpha/beta hydrolase [Acidobacteriota bacterium]HPA27263.1 alpha/beta hydrolase [Acidobacteriota bacterium]HQO19449.1 alpha/beta hydrolase [Acidobacteriota bacterium]HQQ46113.1 alpha/beta hydrolase [Acidobacteriota bacterium]
MRRKVEKTRLVLVHGFPLDSSMWAAQKKHFGKKFKVFCPDLPGFGRSEKRAPKTMEGFARGVKAYFAEEKIDRAIIAGFSMGGYVVQAFYEMFPKNVEGLILVDTRTAADSAEGKAGRDKAIRSLDEEGVAFFADTMPRRLLSETGNREDKLVKEVRKIIMKQKSESVKNALIAMRDRKDRSALLPRVDVPTLLVCGEEDSFTPSEEMIEMANLVKGCSFSMIKRAGHLSNMENPADFNLALEDFLNGSERRKNE